MDKNQLTAAIDLLKDLIGFDSVSSHSNAAISDHVSRQLLALGFDVERTEYQDPQGVTKVNLVARRDPDGSSAEVVQSRPVVQNGPAADGEPLTSDALARQGGLAYFCHTDVVPAVDWTGPGGDPLRAVVTTDRLYGRGACDMKGSLAAMLMAARAVPARAQRKPLWVVCTADEELAFQGARHLVRESNGYRQIAAAQPVAIIGEPTTLSVVHAHKGIAGFRIISRGRAAHSSTTQGINANIAMVPMLQKLLEIEQRTRRESRYHDHRFDPPILSWTFGVSDHCDAVNVTPGKSVAWASLRPMPGIDGEDLIAEAKQRAEELGLEFQRIGGGAPLWVDSDQRCVAEMCELAGGRAQTVCYGTDGGEFSELSQRVVFGPGDIAQAHTSDEWIHLDQLARGIDRYAAAIRRWCS